MLLVSRRIGEAVFIYPNNLPEDMTVGELFAGGQVSIEIKEIMVTKLELG